MAALALQSWLLLVAVLLLHGIASAFVIGTAWKRADDTRDKPDPVTEARMEERATGTS